jgi:hypothetical protein
LLVFVFSWDCSIVLSFLSFVYSSFEFESRYFADFVLVVVLWLVMYEYFHYARSKLSTKLVNFPGQVIRPVDPIVFDRIRVGFHRNLTSFIKNRSDPIPPLWPGIFRFLLCFINSLIFYI